MTIKEKPKTDLGEDQEDKEHFLNDAIKTLKEAKELTVQNEDAANIGDVIANIQDILNDY